MGSVSQSAVRPSLLATLTLATRSALTWTTTAVIRASTATGGVEDDKYSILKPFSKFWIMKTCTALDKASSYNNKHCNISFLYINNDLYILE